MQDFPLVVQVLGFVLTVGLGLLATGGLLNLVSLLPPRPEWDKGLGGIHDQVARRFGPPTLRIGAVATVVATPLLGLAIWLT